MSKLHLRILLPGREAVSREVDSFNATTVEGEVGLLPGHAALLAALKPGPAWFKDGALIDRWALGEGFLEVHDDLVTVLVQTAEHSSEIDVERAQRRRDEVETRLKALTSDIEMRKCELSLAKQIARLQTAGALVAP